MSWLRLVFGLSVCLYFQLHRAASETRLICAARSSRWQTLIEESLKRSNSVTGAQDVTTRMLHCRNLQDKTWTWKKKREKMLKTWCNVWHQCQAMCKAMILPQVKSWLTGKCQVSKAKTFSLYAQWSSVPQVTPSWSFLILSVRAVINGYFKYFPTINEIIVWSVKYKSVTDSQSL